MDEGHRRIAWFVGLYLAGLVGFAVVVYGLRAVMRLVQP